MTKEHFIRMTDATRRFLSRLPQGTFLLSVPTAVCAILYGTMIIQLVLFHDPRLLRFILVPAVCFLTATVLRRLIGRERPYDHFSHPPVGRYTPGKRRSLPSRHAASAAAIAFAVIYVHPAPFVFAGMVGLAVLVAFLRVVSGHHYPSDVLAAVLLSLIISLAGYCR